MELQKIHVLTPYELDKNVIELYNKVTQKVKIEVPSADVISMIDKSSKR